MPTPWRLKICLAAELSMYNFKIKLSTLRAKHRHVSKAMHYNWLRQHCRVRPRPTKVQPLFGFDWMSARDIRGKTSSGFVACPITISENLQDVLVSYIVMHTVFVFELQANCLVNTAKKVLNKVSQKQHAHLRGARHVLRKGSNYMLALYTIYRYV